MNLIKRSIKDLSTYGAGLLFNKVFSFLSMILLTHYLSIEEYGLVGIFILINNYTRTMLSLEISQAACVFFTDEKDLDNKRTIFSSGFVFTCYMNLIGLCLSALLFFIFQTPQTSNTQLSLLTLILLASALFFDSLSYYFMNIIRWLGQSKNYVYGAMLSTFTLLSCIALFVIYLKLALLGVAISFLTSWIVSFLYFLPSIKPYLKLPACKQQIRKMLKFSIPLLLNNIPFYLNAGLDRYLLIAFFGLSFAGIYSAVFSVASIMTLIPLVVQSAIWPLVYKAATNEKGSKEIATLFYLYITVLSTVLVLFSLFSKTLLTTLLDQKYLYSKDIFLILPILSINIVIESITTFFPGMAITKQNGYVVITSIISLFVNLILSLVLIKPYGMLGVSIALLISSIFKIISYAYFSQKLYPINFEASRLVNMLMYFCLTIPIAIYMNLQIPSLGWQALLERFGICIGLCCFLIPFIDHKSFKKR